MLKNQLRDPSLLVERAYVNGAWIEADDGATIDVTNPTDGSVIARVPALQAAETRRAIEAARARFVAWREVPAAERARYLEVWFGLIMENQEDLALIMTTEQGKPLTESRGEIAYGASFVKWFAAEARRVYGDTIPSPAADRRILVLKQPIGVVAAITPWNFPNAMITRKCAPALAAGCTVLVKPSEMTPLSALALAVLAERAGIPAGVFNVLTGLPAGVGGEMTANPDVRKLSFTGSTRIGQLLMSQCAATIKRLSLELGGNAPFIVFDDADLDLAIAGVMQSKFRNAGQTCVCANRILVQDGIYDRFAERLCAAVAELKVGNGLQSGVTIGPLINAAAVDKVARHINDALEKGASIAIGGVPQGEGLYVQPTVLRDANADMLLATEETFGPVAPLFRFKDEAEALTLANATPYGLGAYYFTQDMRRAWRMGERLEFGMVGLNTGIISMEVAPFGGMKQSGTGREGSKYGLDEFLEVKAWHIGGLD
ncbi:MULTISPECIES: NAD-dependent succinate-semialdehyde dehydrogenase [unclassified Pseudomonas]|uniref:NAD-dependent succinate-semialdehyde dehydrogenase n=1 Tax=unclassified Pseudomonas TaxID=196821 RepID=UPI000C88F0EC|nr:MULTISPECIES: NAD-dependent succinate-semialdehyde dehydrogenase [unclassified Pseudomonas]PMX28238.1 succinate-semialdehyde dehydrogenase (NADP(+)) [Pseudomonas sp. GW460-12]PMX36245.1 succinate-semialdehyde dehydrogenase (NADP(+)) [Pseudomonas sp. MPR-R2A4]PMX42509.1 succinate-semialdehyde dehydrogenase (NADP(+)) [Pseudomonas sp. MPR-R2A7]PMX54520.1 succinate-semialdehyde dehydrogenase (NADP(+)) [Pseudomonas sp. MPR-R2A6]PMX91928.1 succinate-semialdehyde dehydrogenase (NADP(+)) [Pseudomon